jgi:hypothetical protein
MHYILNLVFNYTDKGITALFLRFPCFTKSREKTADETVDQQIIVHLMRSYDNPLVTIGVVFDYDSGQLRQ